MKKTFLLLALFFPTILVPLPSSAENNQYPQEYVADYMNSCAENAIARGLPPEMAPELCSCTINKFQSKYTLDQFTQLRQQADANEPAVVESFLEVGFQCVENMLYNNK